MGTKVVGFAHRRVSAGQVLAVTAGIHRFLLLHAEGPDGLVCEEEQSLLAFVEEQCASTQNITLVAFNAYTASLIRAIAPFLLRCHFLALLATPPVLQALRGLFRLDAAAGASGLRAKLKSCAAPVTYFQRRQAGSAGYIEALPSGHFFGGFMLHLRLWAQSWLCVAEIDGHRQRVCRALVTPALPGATVLFLVDPPAADPAAALSPLEEGVALLRDSLLTAPFACLLFDFLYQAIDELYFLRLEWRAVLVSPAAVPFLHLTLCLFDMQNALLAATLFAPKPEFFFRFRELIAAKRLFLAADGRELGLLLLREKLARSRERTAFFVDAVLQEEALPLLRGKLPGLEVRRLGGQPGGGRAAQAAEGWREALGGGQCVGSGQLARFAQNRLQLHYLAVGGRLHLGDSFLCAREGGKRPLLLCVRGRAVFDSAEAARRHLEAAEGPGREEGQAVRGRALGRNLLVCCIPSRAAGVSN